MSSFPIPGLQSVILVDGQVFASIDPNVLKEPMSLSVGNATVPFEPCDANPMNNYALGKTARLDTTDIATATKSVPTEHQLGEIYACWVNELNDWMLSGSETIQLMIARRELGCQIQFQKSITVAQTGTPLHFYAQLASHRAVASLNMQCVETTTGAVTKHTVAFNRAFGGGQMPDGYQQVKIQLPKALGTYEVSISVDYHEYVSDDSGVEPFIFIADVQVSSQTAEKTPILSPYLVPGSQMTPGKQWMVAPVLAYPTAGEAIKLRVGHTGVTVTTLAKPSVRVVENYGHTLKLKADTPQQTTLFVDGKAALRVALGPTETLLRIPAKYLTGATRHLSLKDASGSLTFFETLHLMPAILTSADIIQRETTAPFPTALFPQTPLRYAGLKAQIANADKTTDMAQIAWALKVLEGGYQNVKLKPLTFPKVSKPDVSIVIPAHNKVEVTYLGLCSLLVAHNKASFEVIVVDDASTDETAKLEEIVSGITVIHNEEPQRFIRACNAGAKQARGEYIVLLNNDVEVTTGWLDELLSAFDQFDNVGLTGAKLLYPNGELQDAGGIIWGTGNPWNYGNSQNPNEPRFCYARQADYLSGAAMMVPKAIWNEVGGLSSYLEPMYFEDTDFAFKVREAGYSTWFVPASIVYHYEGMTSGTDVSTGFKKFQEVNRPKFKRRWARDYAHFGKEGHAPDLEKDRGIVGRVLFIDYTTPRVDQDAGSYAAIQEMRLVQSLGYKVSFLPMNMAHLGRYTETLQKMGVEMIYAPFYMSAAEYLDKHATDFDAFYITRYYVAQDTLSRIRANAPQARILFNNADLHFLREIRAAQSEDNAEMMEKARKTRDEELQIINNVDVVLSYNDIEHSVIQAYTEGRANVVKCPWVVDTPDTVPDMNGRSGLSFLGSYRHHPNAEGITWFTREIMPLIHSKIGPIPLTIYGSGMGDDIRALETDLIDPQGFVENVADVYDNHSIFVAPLLSGAGIKGKVLSALAHGIPCVLTPTAAEGVGLRSGHDCFIAETPDDWVKAIRMLDSDPELWHKISANARSYMQDAYSFTFARSKMRAAFEAADLFGSLD